MRSALIAAAENYEPFTPSQPGNAAPGHALFSSQGASLWESDVIEFLGRYLK